MSLLTFAFPFGSIMDVKLFVNAESWQLNGKKD